MTLQIHYVHNFGGLKDSFLLDFLFFKEKFVYLRHISDDMPINKNALVRYKILEKWPEKWPETAVVIINAIGSDNTITISKLETITGFGHTTIKKLLREMQAENIIRRVGPDKGGHWEVIAQETNNE